MRLEYLRIISQAIKVLPINHISTILLSAHHLSPFSIFQHADLLSTQNVTRPLLLFSETTSAIISSSMWLFSTLWTHSVEALTSSSLLTSRIQHTAHKSLIVRSLVVRPLFHFSDSGCSCIRAVVLYCIAVMSAYKTTFQMAHLWRNKLSLFVILLACLPTLICFLYFTTNHRNITESDSNLTFSESTSSIIRLKPS